MCIRVRVRFVAAGLFGFGFGIIFVGGGGLCGFGFGFVSWRLGYLDMVSGSFLKSNRIPPAAVYTRFKCLNLTPENECIFKKWRFTRNGDR
jgi:hypothetical protein